LILNLLLLLYVVLRCFGCVVVAFIVVTADVREIFSKWSNYIFGGGLLRSHTRTIRRTHTHAHTHTWVFVCGGAGI